MDDLDLFDLVKLSFDPPETNTKTIQKKIDEEIARLQSAWNNDRTKEQKKQEFEYLQSISVQIISADGKKLVPLFKQLAEKKTQQRIREFSALVQVWTQFGRHTVTKTERSQYKTKFGLSDKNIDKVLTDAKVEIIDFNTKAAFPKFPGNLKAIQDNIDKLRHAKDPNPNAVDNSVVDSLYAFAAYFENDIQHIASYKSKDRVKLHQIFTDAVHKYSERNDPIADCCKNLSNMGANVFGSDEKRKEYDDYLLYCSPKLTQLFTQMKQLSLSQLEDSKIAESCIRQISEYFPQYETALAIYNKEGKCNYEPPVSKYIVKCHHCEHINEFESEKEAIQKNKCQNCKNTLFKPCKKCGKSVLESKDICPFCQYVFHSAALFGEYFQKAQAALQKNEFDHAKQYLFDAQTVAPEEKARIDALKEQISQAESILKKPIDRLHQLIAKREFMTAESELGTIINKYPNLNIHEFNKTITEAITKADKGFASANSLPASKKADACISILMQCADYQPALAFLRATSPLPCGKVMVSADAKAGQMNIAWQHSTEQGVSYRLIRKMGKTAALSAQEGDILVDSTINTSFVDKNVKSGVFYTYTVFVVRYGVYSTGVSQIGMVYGEVKNVSASQLNNSVRLSFRLPENCRGAKIIRSSHQSSITLCEAAHSPYDDNHIQYGNTYAYTILAIYDGNQHSQGVVCEITPSAMIDSFSFQAAYVRENIYNISWHIPYTGIRLRVMVDDDVLAEAMSDDKELQVTLPQERYCRIHVCAHAGGKWIESDNKIEVSTCTSCKIDEKKTTSSIEEKNDNIQLKIYLSGSIPETVDAFYYTVRTAQSKNKWASKDEMTTAYDMHKISVANYLERGFIPYQIKITDDATFYVSVFTGYNSNGKYILSEAEKITINRPLVANLFWGVESGGFIRKILQQKTPQLSVEWQCNRPIYEVPELWLMISKQHIKSPDDEHAEVLMKIPAVRLDFPSTQYQQVYPIQTNQWHKNHYLALFARNIAKENDIAYRWKKGFFGRS